MAKEIWTVESQQGELATTKAGGLAVYLEEEEARLAPVGLPSYKCVRYVPASEHDEALSAAFELLEWADNWMPDEANDQGARKARNNLRRLLEVARG